MLSRADGLGALVRDWLLPVGVGALAGCAYQPVNWGWAVLGALAAFQLIVVARPTARQAALQGWLFGLGMNLVAIGWVHVIAWFVVPPLVAMMALWSALVALVLHSAARLSRHPLWLALAAALGWSLAEFGACRVPFGGFGWLRLAYTQADTALAGWLPSVGVAGVSFLVALAAGLALAVVQPRTSWLRRAAGLLGLVLVGIGAGISDGIEPAPQTGEVAVGLVQGNVDGGGGPQAMGYARSVTNNHVAETVTLMARGRAGVDPKPDFVLWPENSTDVDPTRDLQTRMLIDRATQISQLPILVGAVMAGPGTGERKTSALWWPLDGHPTARYDKRNLVPFGEWIPMRSLLLPLVPMLQEVGAQSVPGTGPGVLDVSLLDGRQVRLGDVICFELAWDQTVYDTVRHGAQLVVVQSNTGTYGGTGQPAQQFAITRVRAMELRREMVPATTNSLSGLIHPDGSVTNVTRQGTAAARTYLVPMRDGRTPAVVVGPAVEMVASLGAILLLALNLGQSLRSKARCTG